MRMNEMQKLPEGRDRRKITGRKSSKGRDGQIKEWERPVKILDSTGKCLGPFELTRL